jgi:GNAT superfamily N-acetyltransferase
MIRRAAQGDGEALATLHRASIRALCADAYSPEQLAAWTAVLTSAAYETLIDVGHVLIAVDEEVPVGLGVCEPAESLINAAYVAPGSVRRGIGRELVAAMEAELLAAGASEVMLNATLNAVAFYASLGYRDRGMTTNVLPSGVVLPAVAMTKQLSIVNPSAN